MPRDKVMSKEGQDLSKFLDQVNELESIMKGMRSGDEATESDSMKKADEIIAKYELKQKDRKEKEESIARTVTNRTIINKDAYVNDEVTQGGIPPCTDQAGFMAALEVDARERRERKKKMTQEANVLKEKGNDFYKNGELEKAVELYTEALTKVKDLQPLWTNRALTLNRLRRYEEALCDCDWALRVNAKSSKAYIQQGKAYLGLEQYENARESYRKILDYDQSFEQLVENYIHEVDVSERSRQDLEQAKKLFDEEDINALGMNELLDKLKMPQSKMDYYLGGLQLVLNALRSDQDRLLFKANGGFQLHNFEFIQRSFKRSTTEAEQNDHEICIALYQLYERACAGLETSQIILFEDDFFKDQSLLILESRDESLDLVQLALLQFLKIVCRDKFGLKLVLTLDNERFGKSIFNISMRMRSSCSVALDFLFTLTKNSNFNSRLRPLVIDVIIPLYVTIETSCAQRQRLILTVFVNMTSDAQLRRSLNDNEDLWQISAKFVKKLPDTDVMNALLVFLINLTVEKSENAAKFAREFSKVCITKIRNEEFQKAVVGLVSRFLPKYAETKLEITAQFVEQCVKFCSKEDPDLIKYSIRCLACVTKDAKFATIIIENSGLKILIQLVSTKSDDVIANAVIAITDLLESDNVKPHVNILKRVDFVKTLLVLVRDSLSETVKKNAAILLARMTKMDPAHLERLRELHGIEIMLQNVRAESL